MSSNEKPNANSPAVVGATMHIEGTITGDEDLIIEGRVDGSVFFQNAIVTVAKSGMVRADIQAKIIKVEGEVRGELRGAESVEICPSGTAIGDIRSPRVMLRDGCQFKGLVDMDHKDSNSVSSAERNLAAKSKPPSPKALAPNQPRPIAGGPRPVPKPSAGAKLAAPGASKNTNSTS